MILYGSVLRGDAGSESDVDLLVVATGDVRAVGRALGDIAFEVMLEHGELISPLVYGPDEYRHPHHFLRLVQETWTLDKPPGRKPKFISADRPSIYMGIGEWIKPT